jgi:hypothetical protein
MIAVNQNPGLETSANQGVAIFSCKTLIGALGISLLAIPGLAGEPGVCRHLRLGELPITELDDAIAVPATINGQAALMEVATGLPFTFFYEDRLETPLRGKDDKLEVGGLAITNLDATNGAKHQGLEDRGRASRFPPDGIPRNVVGVIGEDFLRNADLDIDLKNKKLTLYRGLGCSENSKPLVTDAYVFVPFTLVKPFRWPRAITTVEINGYPLKAAIGTEYADTRLSLRAAKFIGIDIDKAQPITADVNSADGGKGLWLAQLASFSIGEETIRPVRLRVGGRDPDRQGLKALMEDLEDVTWDVVLGRDFLMAHHVLISHSDRRFYYSYIGGKIFDRGSAAP